MKVLMYGWEFPPRISGGLGVACYAIVKELAKKQVDLTLVLPQTVNTDHIDHVNFVNCRDVAATSLGQDSAGIVNIKYPQVVTYLYPYANANSFKQLLSNETIQDFLCLLSKMSLPEEIKSMARAAVEAQMVTGNITDRYETNLLTEVFRYAFFAGSIAVDVAHDVIHAHDWLTVLAALEAKRRSHKPLVLHIHALETDRSGLWVDKRIFAIEKYGMEQADQIIAVSQYTKNNIVQYYGIAPEKIAVVHNGIYSDGCDSSSSKVNKRHNMVLFLGRITHQKGPCFFIEVAKKVLEKRPDIQFVLAGSGDLLASMIERTASLRIGKNVHFTGFLNGKEVSDIYKLADVYVMPSVSEPFGLSALEALSHNVPAIISKQSGVAEVLRHALVTDFWDIEEMAAKILALLKYQALGKTAVANSAEDLRLVTWGRAVDKIIEVYSKVT